MIDQFNINNVNQVPNHSQLPIHTDEVVEKTEKVSQNTLDQQHFWHSYRKKLNIGTAVIILVGAAAAITTGLLSPLLTIVYRL